MRRRAEQLSGTIEYAVQMFRHGFLKESLFPDMWNKIGCLKARLLDSLTKIKQIIVRVNALHFGAMDQGIENGGGFGSNFRGAKEVIFKP